jgi:hypothetical protein
MSRRKPPDTNDPPNNRPVKPSAPLRGAPHPRRLTSVRKAGPIDRYGRALAIRKLDLDLDALGVIWNAEDETSDKN